MAAWRRVALDIKRYNYIRFWDIPNKANTDPRDASFLFVCKQTQQTSQLFSLAPSERRPTGEATSFWKAFRS